MRVNVTEQGLVIPKEFLTGIQAVDIRRDDRDQIILTPTVENAPAHSEGVAYVPKTPLGKRLWSLRQEAIAAGMKLLTAEEIEQEIAEQRDRH
jgi:virulence-associated protein VagC